VSVAKNQELSYCDRERWNSLKLTISAFPAETVAENLVRILTMGSSHFINLSSPFRNSWNASAWVRNTSKTSAGESHPSSCVANGWEYKSCLVSFLYFSEAALNIEMKFEIDGSVSRVLADIGITVK
jgi:hypothetical protein